MPIQIIWGNDQNACNRFIQKIIDEKVAQTWREINVSYLNGNDDDEIKRAFDEILTPPLGDGSRVVVLKNNPIFTKKNEEIFKLIEAFYNLLKTENWIQNYIFWELELFKILGFDLDFKSLVDKKIISNEITYVTKFNNEKKIIPNFLIHKSLNLEDPSTLLKGLQLVSDYLDKSILKPNNLTQPLSRLQFINTLK